MENNGKSKKRKKGGMNKKRPRDQKICDANKLCLSVVRGLPCSYGDSCKFSHDIKAILADRPPDIKEIPSSQMTLPNGATIECPCPNYRLWGRCDYAIMCRVGQCHLNMSTGENLTRSDCELDEKNQPLAKSGFVKNVLRKEVQQLLRKKKFPFVCKRGNVRHKQNTQNNVKNEEIEKPHNTLNSSTNPFMPQAAEPKHTPDVDLTPLPTKRKLIDFRNKVYIAPLTTVGNLPFRRIMKHYGADITCGEMAVASNLLEGKPSEWALLKRHPSEDVFGVQIAAGFPDQFTRISEVLEKEVEIDFLDMNLGCPIDVICGKGAGSALMLREKKLKECLVGMTNVLSCPITIKMRTGWDESKPLAHTLIPKIQSWGFDGVGAMMLHGRSRLQRYTKLARWDYISEVCNDLKLKADNDSIRHIPLIGNGDIFSHTDYEERILSNPNISPTAMLGRGALIKPWLPTEIKERRHWDISASERLDMLKDFVRFGLEHWGSDDQGVNRTRRFMLEWLSFLYRYVPIGLLEVLPQQMNHRPPQHMCGRNDLETLMMSKHCGDWIKISELLLGKVPGDFDFQPKHKASGYK